jgi:adenylate cyclase class 2
MSFEVELKFRVDELGRVARMLRDSGASLGPAVNLVDLYLAHPERDFAATDEAFRLRSIGKSNRITYKGPKQAGLVKTREEIELGFEPGERALEAMTQLFLRLGFRAVARVEKQRATCETIVRGCPMVISLDDAGPLGCFVEVETTAQDGGSIEAARAAVSEMGAGLGLHEVEPRSYLRMTLDREVTSRRSQPG